MPNRIRLHVEELQARINPTSFDNFDWAASVGGTGTDNGRSVTADTSGNVYVSGGFQVTADFDPGVGVTNLSSAGGTDLFLAKYTPAGNLAWVRQVGASGEDEGRGVAVDGAGNVYTMGYFSGTVDFDPGSGTANLTSVGASDLFVSKWDSSGSLIWVNQLTPKANGYNYGYGLKADAAGNVYIVGVFSDTQDFDPGVGTTNLTSAGSNDIFVSKFDNAGNFVWAKHFGGIAGDSGNAIAVDGAGNVYFTGSAQGTAADFDPGPGVYFLPGLNGPKIFVAKLDSSGNLTWAKAFIADSYAVGFGIAVDSVGSVYTTGLFNATVDFDPGPGTAYLSSTGNLPPVSMWDAYVSKLDSEGNFVWANKIGGTSMDEGYGIAVDAQDAVYSTGKAYGVIDFDPGPENYDLATYGSYVRKIDKSGNFVWAKAFAVTGGTVGYEMAVDLNGNVITVGSFGGSPGDFDPGPGTYTLTGKGGNDIFLVKLRPDPDPATITNVTSSSDNGDYAVGASIDVTVSFSDVVTVTGTPLLTLETGAIDATAVYSGGSGTNALTFTYLVGDGESTPDLDYVSTSALTLNGGSIRDAVQDAVLTLAIPGTTGSLGVAKDIVIDTPIVTVSAAPISVTEDGASNLVYTFTRVGPTADSLTVDFTVSGGAEFNSDYTQSGADDYTLTNGTITFLVGSSTATISIDPIADHITELDEDVVLSLMSGTGYSVVSPSVATGTISNDDIPPDTMIITGPGFLTTSRSATFTFTGSTTPSGNGITFEGSLDGAPFAATTSPKKFTNFTEGAHTYEVRAIDEFGNVDATPASYTWIVDTVKPTVTISPPSMTVARAGDTISYTITYSDANLQQVTLTPASITLIKSMSAKGTVQVSGSGNVRTVSISNLSGNGTLGISIKANTAVDLVGLKAKAIGPSAKFAVDGSGPVVTISSPSRATVGGTADFIVTYTDVSLAPASLSVEQITVLTKQGMTTDAPTVTQLDDSHFKVSVSNISSSGTLSIQIAAGVAEDTFGQLSLGPITSKIVKVR